MSFMSLIRKPLGATILFLDRVFSPKPLVRSAENQKNVDEETRRMALYQFESCPFCVKVRREIRRLGLKIELRDVTTNQTYKEELIKKGGEYQVPCLKIGNADGSEQWMYESSEIIRYLKEKFSPAV